MAKKHIIFLLFCLFQMTILSAQEARKHDISADVAAQGVVGHNLTYKWFEGADVKGVLNYDNIKIALNFEALTVKTYSFGLSVQPSFEVCKNGYLFVDGTLHSRLFRKYKAYEFVYSGSVGFRMRHFLVQLGVYSRTIDALDRDWHSLNNYVTEPFNFQYKLAISVMGFDHPWDVYLVGSDFNEFEFERMWEPLFTLGGRWDFKDRWSAVAEGMLKPAGVFHGAVKYYEAVFRVGIRHALSVRDKK